MDGSIEGFVLLQDLDEECKAFSEDLPDTGAPPIAPARERSALSPWLPHIAFREGHEAGHSCR